MKAIRDLQSSFANASCDVLPSEIRLEHQFSSGLARSVGIYSLKIAKVRRYLVLAFGNDASVSQRNRMMLGLMPPRVTALFARNYFVQSYGGSGQYVEAMEYLKGPTLAEAISTHPTDQLLGYVRSVAQSLNTLHSIRAVSHTAQAPYCDSYHKARIAFRLRQLSRLFPSLAAAINRNGCRVRRDGRGGELTLRSLSALKRKKEDVACLIHGDCKPENIILSDTRARFIDAKLEYGDPFVDYAKLYQWLFIGPILSTPPGEKPLLTQQNESCISMNGARRALRPDFNMDLRCPRSVRKAIYQLMSQLGADRWSYDEWGRFCLCSGSWLVWQAGRLMEVASERASVARAHSDGRSGKVIHSSKFKLPIARDLAESKTLHVRMAFVLGAYYLWVASEILRTRTVRWTLLRPLIACRRTR